MKSESQNSENGFADKMTISMMMTMVTTYITSICILPEVFGEINLLVMIGS